MIYCDCLISFSIVFSNFLHVIGSSSTALLLLMNNILFCKHTTLSIIYRHSVDIRFISTVGLLWKRLYEHLYITFVWTYGFISVVYIPGSRITGSCGNVLHFKKLPNYFQVCTILLMNSHQECVRVPIFPYPHQHFDTPLLLLQSP